MEWGIPITRVLGRGGRVWPVEAICLRCGEAVTPQDGGRMVPAFTVDCPKMLPIHRVCEQRAAVGGVNHLRRLCACYGGTQPADPPGLSRYEAAVAAVEHWTQKQRFEPNATD